MISVVAVVGPTASGKTALALALADRLGTEIISADSMQMYKGLEIGTAAPTPAELERIKHHFVSFLDPGQGFSAGDYERLSRDLVSELNAQGKVAVVVGGSGLYVSALIDGLFAGPGKNAQIRERLQQEAAAGGIAHLYARLKAADPDYANAISSNDLRRIVRALEVYELTGSPLSQLHREHRDQSPSLSALQVAIDYPRAILYDRINHRVDRMLANGLLEEVAGLMERGYEADLLRLRSLGYREMMAYLRGRQTLEEATELMKRNTRRYAKRQLTWFRGDSRVHWLPAATYPDEGAAAETVLTWLAEFEHFAGSEPVEKTDHLT